jgi:BolA protein
MIRHKGGENPDLVNALKLYKDQAVMPQTSSTRDLIHAALQDRFSPQRLEVIDESDLHIGHAGHTGAGNSHFKVIIISESFKGMQRLERHRKVYEALDHFLKNGVHALNIKAFAPDEI